MNREREMPGRNPDARNEDFYRRLMRMAGWAILLGVLVFCPDLFAVSGEAGGPQIIAYVFTRGQVLQPGQIAAQRVTRINYAFANIKDGLIVEGYPTDAANYSALNALKQQNPSLKVLASVGGWLWSGNFSDAVLTKQSRQAFIDSVIAFIERYNLDGLDIDWEYPGQVGAGNHFRPEDRENYTAVLKELRQRFNREEKKLHRRLYLSIATGTNANFLVHTEMGKAQKYVDTVNLMAYDFYEPGSEPTTGENAPLFTNPRDPKHESADQAVRAYEAAGVPASKIVLGVPFYGHEWGQVPAQNHGLFQPGKPVPGAYANYGNITSTMLKPGSGFVRYWDTDSAVPYIYNASSQIFVSYDDPQSMVLKSRYVIDRHLAGVMFWDYMGDPTGALLDSIDETLLLSGAAHGAHAR